mgnify:CR=1 FL=1
MSLEDFLLLEKAVFISIFFFLFKSLSKFYRK